MKREMWLVAVTLLALTGQARSQDNPKPPGKVDPDYRAVLEDAKILDASYDATDRKVTWTLKARKDLSNLKGAYKVQFLDAKNGVVKEADLEVDHASVKEGKPFTASVDWPDDDALKQVKKMVWVKGDATAAKALPADKGKDDDPKKEDDPKAASDPEKDPNLPVKGIWDFNKAFAKDLTIVKTTYDSDKRRIVWLCEAKQGLNFGNRYRVEWRDADEVKVDQSDLTSEPFTAKKGERFRLYLQLPNEENFKKTKKATAFVRD
jgi:hypothetical protein